MVADIKRVGRTAAVLAAVWTATAQTQGLPHGWLWHDPGDVAALDFGGTVGAPVHLPKPPFTFVREDPSGTQPKVFVRDAEGATWNVKFGYEVHPESFSWRLVRACGYFVEPQLLRGLGQVRRLQADQTCQFIAGRRRTLHRWTVSVPRSQSEVPGRPQTGIGIGLRLAARANWMG
jgi:hypothetical protein